MFGNPGTTELPLMDAFAIENEHPLHARPAGGGRHGDGGRLCAGLGQARGGQPPRRARPRQRHGHALRRAEGGLADPGDRRPARAELQRHRADPVGRPADHRAAAGEMVRARCTASPTCRGWCIAPPRPRWRRRPGRCSCRCPATSCEPTAISICWRRRAWRRACAAIATAVEAAADLLASAKRPVIMAGDAVAQSRAPCRAGRAGGASRRAGLHRIRAEHGFVSVLASAVSRLDDPARSRTSARCSTSMTCCSRSAATCSRCRCRPTSIRCRRTSSSSISTPIPGSSARTIRRRSPSSAIRRRRCRRSPRRSASA